MLAYIYCFDGMFSVMVQHRHPRGRDPIVVHNSLAKLMERCAAVELLSASYHGDHPSDISEDAWKAYQFLLSRIRINSYRE